MKKSLVIVCGYGCNPNGYRIAEYIKYAVEKVFRYKIAKIITTGGFTNPKEFPGISEASMMKGELIRRGIDPDIILLEEDALTTNQNLEFCRQIIDDLVEKPSCVYIICDSIRTYKVRIIANKYLANYCYRELGFDFHRSSREKFRQIFATIKDIIALWFPFVENIAVWLRKRAWGIK